MAPFFALELATGLVLLHRPGETAAIGGTCFPFRNHHTFLTAAHCVPEDIQIVVLQGRHVQRTALEVERHPTCDVALIRTDPNAEPTPYDDLPIISTVTTDLVLGGDFLTYGFPADGVPDGRATGRLLKGHFQRYFNYQSPSGRSYWAGEMSVPTPAGHSGGPVVRPSSPQVLDGIVTANYESYVLLDQVEEVERDGKQVRIESRRVVTYGITAMVTGFREWLSQREL